MHDWLPIACYHLVMQCAGFVLLGGQSRRMGRDKALLPYGSVTFAQHAAERVRAAVGSVVLVGDPEKYGHLGYPVIPDIVPNSGPMGGIHAALSTSSSDWSLILACDLPYVSVDELKVIVEAARSSPPDTRCVILQNKANRPQPLCAAYHRDCLPIVEHSLADKHLRVMDLMAQLPTIALPITGPASLFNVNTPAEWPGMQYA